MKKGFATSAILYTMLLLFLVLMVGILNNLQNKKTILDALKQDTIRGLEQDTVTDAILDQISMIHATILSIEDRLGNTDISNIGDGTVTGAISYLDDIINNSAGAAYGGGTFDSATGIANTTFSSISWILLFSSNNLDVYYINGWLHLDKGTGKFGYTENNFPKYSVGSYCVPSIAQTLTGDSSDWNNPTIHMALGITNGVLTANGITDMVTHSLFNAICFFVKN